MAAAATINFTASLTGIASGTKTISIPVTVATPIDASNVSTLSSGANTITPPAGATCAILMPPAANAVVVTLKGVAGDTGVILSLLNPSFVSLAASPTTFVLNAASSLVGYEIVYI